MNRRNLKRLKSGDRILVGNHCHKCRVTETCQAQFLALSIGGRNRTKPDRGVTGQCRGD